MTGIVIFSNHQFDSNHYSLTLVSVYDTSVDLSGPWPGDAITVITLLPSLDDIFIVLLGCVSCQKIVFNLQDWKWKSCYALNYVFL